MRSERRRLEAGNCRSRESAAVCTHLRKPLGEITDCRADSSTSFSTPIEVGSKGVRRRPLRRRQVEDKLGLAADVQHSRRSVSIDFEPQCDRGAARVNADDVLYPLPVAGYQRLATDALRDGKVWVSHYGALISGTGRRGTQRHVASLSTRKITPLAGRHGVGCSFHPGAVHAAPSLLDRMSSTDSGLVGVRKSASVVVSAFGRLTSGSDLWRVGYRKGKSDRSCKAAGTCAMSSSSQRRSRVRPSTWRMFGRAGVASSCRCERGATRKIELTKIWIGYSCFSAMSSATGASSDSIWMATPIWRAIVRFRKPKRPLSGRSAGISIARHVAARPQNLDLHRPRDLNARLKTTSSTTRSSETRGPPAEGCHLPLRPSGAEPDYLDEDMLPCLGKRFQVGRSGMPARGRRGAMGVTCPTCPCGDSLSSPLAFLQS
jgi:hypothetical protein